MNCRAVSLRLSASRELTATPKPIPLRIENCLQNGGLAVCARWLYLIVGPFSPYALISQ